MAITYASWEIQINTPFDSGTITGTTANTLTCTGKAWTVNDLIGSYVWIISGTGAGQSDIITANTSNTITLRNNWTTVPTGAVFIVSYKIKHIVAALPAYAIWDTAEANRRVNVSVWIRVFNGGFFGINRENLNFSVADKFLNVDAGGYFQSGTRLNNDFPNSGVEGGAITGKNVSTSYQNPYLIWPTRLYATYITHYRALSDTINAFTLYNPNVACPYFEAYDCMFTNCSIYVHTGNKIVGCRGFGHQNTTSVDASFSIVGSPTLFKNNQAMLSPRVDAWSLSCVGVDIIDHFCNVPANYDIFLFNFAVQTGGVIYLWNHTPSKAWINSLNWYTNNNGRVYRGNLIGLDVSNSGGAKVQGAVVGVIDKDGNAGILTGKEAKVSGSATNAFPINSYTITTDSNWTYTGIIGSGEGIPVLYALYTRNSQFVSTETPYFNYTFKVRKYGYKYLSRPASWSARSKEAIVLDTNSYVVANESTAGAYTGITINGTAKTISISGARTIQELYDYSQWWTAQSTNITYDEPITTSNGIEFTLATGWTITPNELLDCSGKKLSGGTIILSTTGTINPCVGTTTLSFSTVGTYDLSGGEYSWTVTLVNTSGGSVEVVLPVGVTYVNSWPNITVRNPYTYQSVTISWPVAGSRIQIYDTANNEELYEWVPTFPYTWTDSNPYASDRDIRVRVMYKDWATAKLWWEQNIGTSTFTNPALSVLVTQEDDSVYNTNWIDGATVSWVSIVDSELRVNVSTGTISWQELYAYETDWLNTSEGIIDEGRYTVAKDIANYAWYNFKIKNVTNWPTEPLIVTGWYGVDGDTGQSIDMIDNTGWTIIFAPDHVVPKIITVAWASVITGDVADIIAPLWVMNWWIQKASKLIPYSQDI